MAPFSSALPAFDCVVALSVFMAEKQRKEVKERGDTYFYASDK